MEAMASENNNREYVPPTFIEEIIIKVHSFDHVSRARRKTATAKGVSDLFEPAKNVIPIRKLHVLNEEENPLARLKDYSKKAAIGK